MEEYAVVVKDLVKVFGSEIAVNHLSLRVYEGEYLFLLGPSGCGKTTTLRCIAGLEEPTSGSIWVQGRNVDGVPAHQRDTATVFQDFAIFPHMTVEQNLEFGLRMRRVSGQDRTERVNRMLELLDLEGLGGKTPDELSGGELQRVGIARALAVEPAVLLLDEPLASLDPALAIDVLFRLKTLHDDLGLTFVHVSHDHDEAMAVAERIVVMNEGRIEQIGTPQEIFEQPQTRFVAKFIQNNNMLEGKVVSVDGDLVTMANELGEFRAMVRDVEVSEGADVALAVRYDRMSLKGETEYDNKLRGRVKGLEIVGTTATHLLALDTGQEFRFLEHLSTLRRFDAGEYITVCWKSADSVLLSR
jgi:spermidine/putrescine transport system ATP-binding protein